MRGFVDPGPRRRSSFVGLSACLAVAVLPAWTAVNNARNLDVSHEVLMRTPLQRALDAQGRCLIEEPSGLECEGLSLATGTLRDTVSFFAVGSRDWRAVMSVEPLSPDNDHLVVQASVIQAPWVVCQGIFDIQTGEDRYRCSTDRLAQRASFLRRLILPIALASVALAVVLSRRWSRSRVARGVGSILAAVTIALFIVSGGPQLIPDFPGYGRSLGDSIWSWGMLLK